MVARQRMILYSCRSRNVPQHERVICCRTCATAVATISAPRASATVSCYPATETSTIRFLCVWNASSRSASVSAMESTKDGKMATQLLSAVLFPTTHWRTLLRGESRATDPFWGLGNLLIDLDRVWYYCYSSVFPVADWLALYRLCVCVCVCFGMQNIGDCYGCRDFTYLSLWRRSNWVNNY